MLIDTAGDDRCSAGRSRNGRIAELIAEDFYRDRLDLTSRDIDPQAMKGSTRAQHIRCDGGNDRAVRLFLTFISAMNRARDADQLWDAAIRLYRDRPESFDPQHVAGLEPDVLREVLKSSRVSRRHGPDSNAWHQIAKSLCAGLKSPVTEVIDTGRGDAKKLLQDVKSRDDGGRARFPMLRGPKVGPMWVRMMAYPGRAQIDCIKSIPVAVDVQVRRATENLAVAATRGWPLRRAKCDIQKKWMNAVSEGHIAGPPKLEGSCAALDPALWFFGRHGCGHCEKAKKKVRFGRACDFCTRFAQHGQAAADPL